VTVRGWPTYGLRIDVRAIAAWAVTAFVFTIPFEEILTIPLIGSPTRLVGLLALPLGVIALYGRGRVRFQSPPLFVVLAAAFVAWNLLSYLWSYEPSVTLRTAGRFAQLLAFVWLIAEYCRERTRLLTLLQAFVLGNYVAFGITVFNVIVVSGGRFRDVGPFNANQFAIILALGIPMAALLMSERRSGMLHAWNTLYPVVAAIGVILAASRSGMIVSAVTLMVLPFAMMRLPPLRRVVVSIGAVAALVLAFSYAPQVFPDVYRSIERLQETTDEITTGTLTGRTTIWRETLSVFETSPILGIGAGAARFALVDTALARVKAVHNAYLSVAASTGLIGLFLFIGLVALAFVAALFAEPGHRPFFIVLAIGLMVAMVPANSEGRKDTWFILAALAVQRPILLTVDPVPRPGAGPLLSPTRRR
jgi:O-antigen ligase